MKKRLIADMRPPYGGEYQINRPDLGMVGRGYIFPVLVKSVIEYRKANSIPVGLGFEDELEQLVCQQYSKECEDQDEAKVRKRPFTLSDIIAGTRVMFSHWMNDRKLVSREVAESRADKCVSCPHNEKFVKSCSGICPELSAIVSVITNHQGTNRDYRLHQCNICGCFLQSAIWMDLESQLKPLTDEQREAFTKVPNCWKVPTS